MSDSWSRRLTVSILIALLHLPLIFHAFTLYADLQPGSGVLDLDPISAVLLIIFFLVPHLVMLLADLRWNPERAHPGEMI